MNGSIVDISTETKCVRCTESINGRGVKTDFFGRPVYRHLACQREFEAVRKENYLRKFDGTAKKEKADPGAIDVAPGYSECTAKYHSRCMFGCKGPIRKGSRMVWKRGTRITLHPRCWRNRK